MPRLVACHHCHILQRIPDVAKGTPLVPARLQWTSGEDYVYHDEDKHPVMVPAYDPILEDFVIKHEHGIDERHFVNGQVVQVWQVDQKTWDAIDVVTEIKKELQANTSSWYAERDEYRDAATRCYNAHGNPDLSTGCRDYMDDSKRIGQGTYKDDDGHDVTVPPKLRQYLCYLCPYQQSYINVELRRRKGAYDDNEHMKRLAKTRRVN
jgi:hypothetical protein